MNNQKIINSKINISVNRQTYSIFYSYKKETTFQELLEYFSYLCPSLNICLCYHFKAAQMGNQFNRNYFNISKNYKILDYSNYLNNLHLYTDQKKCEHLNNNYLICSKAIIYSQYLNQTNILNEKNKLLEDLQKKNEILIQSINGDLEKIQNLKNLGVLDKNFRPNGNNSISIAKNNEIKMAENNNNLLKPKFNEFYDVIVHIDSIKDINKGWKIELSPRAEKHYQDYKTEKVLRIGVIGNANKGKSFLLSKISKMDFPSGTSIKTEGLSIKYPDLTLFKDRKIALLDSAGMETPVLIMNEEKDKEKKNEIFKEKSREKLITELFLQNYIVNNSDILIVVVDSLSFSEQKLLMKVKKEMERAKRKIPLYIIHNLKTFTTKAQIDEYINNTLLKSATFTLEQGHNINTKLNKNSEVCNYYEIDQDKEQKIVHLIYANESSPAGQLYNQYALDFIENSYQQVYGLQPFDVIETIKERYIKVSKDIKEKTEKEEKITKDSFDNSKPNLIKLKSDNEIILKKCLIDELGFSNFKANGFEPMYNIFSKEDKIIVRVEAPGNCTIQSKIEIQGEYNVIKLTGEKIKDKEPENLDKNIFNLREIGKYVLEIPLKIGEYRLRGKKPKQSYVRGVYILEYELETFDVGTEINEIPNEEML